METPDMATTDPDAWEDAGEDWKGEGLNPNRDDRGEECKDSEAEEVEEADVDYSPSGHEYWKGVERICDKGPLRAWWIRRLYSACENHAPTLGAEVWNRMVTWLVGSENSYVNFCTPDTYRSGDPGSHQIDEKTLSEDLSKALAWATGAPTWPDAYGATSFNRPTDPIRIFGTLEAWVEAETTGKLGSGVVREPEARMVLTCARNAGRLSEEAHQVTIARLLKWRRCRARLPRLCHHCGAEFSPKDGRVKNYCPGCLSRGKGRPHV